MAPIIAAPAARWLGSVTFREVVDLHCHVLPGIDDGPVTIDRSIDLARAAAAAGMKTIVATPHVSLRYPNTGIEIQALVARVNERLAAEGVGIRVEHGAEVALTRVEDIETEELRRLQLGGGSWLLIEPPFSQFALGVDVMLAELRGRVRGIVLAHPERAPMFHRDPQMLASLVRAGTLTSITAGSLTGRFGRVVRRFALEMVEQGLVHNVSSDAHDLSSRPPGIADALRRSGLMPLADWLTQEVPAAILSDGEIPRRPARQVSLPGGRWRRWRRKPRRPLRPAS